VFNRRQLARYLVLDLPRSIWRCRRHARDADIVHINTSIQLGGIIGGRLARRPTVLHVRESYAGHERKWRAYCWIIKPFTTRVVATSKDIAAEVVAAGLGDRTVVIHNGVVFGDLPTERMSVDGPVVAVGRINDWKGQDVLIEAVALLRQRGTVVPVEIAGDALPGQKHRADQLVELANLLGVGEQVRLLGYVDDVQGVLDRASIFVLPSVRPEPFGLALVDAMGRALACIATDAGGPREIIEHGRTGLLVPMRDAAALADAIEELWSDPALRERLGRAAALDVRARFSIDVTATRVAGVYEDLLTGSSHPQPKHQP
jgi:glycosyltransferase involved in cell wall biosynthesis